MDHAASIVASIFGSSGIVGLVAYLVSLWKKSKQDKRQEERTKDSVVVTDAKTANAILLESLRELREENARRAKTIQRLEREKQERDELIVELRADIEKIREQFKRAEEKLTLLEGE